MGRRFLCSGFRFDHAWRSGMFLRGERCPALRSTNLSQGRPAVAGSYLSITFPTRAHSTPSNENTRAARLMLRCCGPSSHSMKGRLRQCMEPLLHQVALSDTPVNVKPPIMQKNTKVKLAQRIELIFQRAGHFTPSHVHVSFLPSVKADIPTCVSAQMNRTVTKKHSPASVRL